MRDIMTWMLTASLLFVAGCGGNLSAAPGAGGAGEVRPATAASLEQIDQAAVRSRLEAGEPIEDIVLWLERSAGVYPTYPDSEAKLAALAAEARAHVEPDAPPRKQVDQLSRYLFETAGFEVVEPDEANPDRRYASLSVLLEERAGTCLPLSLLYLALGRRLGLDFAVVAQPRHVYLRWQGEGEAFNIDPSAEGRQARVDQCFYEAPASGEVMAADDPYYPGKGFFSRPLTDEELVVSVLGHLATELDEQGEHAAALSLKRLALEVGPRHLGSLLDIARAHAVAGNTAAALETLNRAIQIEPDYWVPWGAKALVLAKTETPAAALAAADRAVSLGAHEPGAWHLKFWAEGQMRRPEAALRTVEQGLTRFPDDPDLLEGRALLLASTGDYDAALPALDAVLAQDPARVHAWSTKGYILIQKRKGAEALACFDRVIELAPDYPRVWVLRSIPLNSLDRHEEAWASLEQAIERDPSDWLAYYQLGHLAAHLGDWQAAADAYGAAIERAPEHLPQEGWPIDLPEHRASIYVARGSHLWRLGERDAAKAAFEHALQTLEDPAARARVYAARGRVRLETGDAELALHDYQEATRLAPDEAWNWQQLSAAADALGMDELKAQSQRRADELREAEAQTE